MPTKLRALPHRVARLVSAVVAEPVEVALSLPEYISERSAHPVGYVIEEGWEARLHRMLGAPWPCTERESAVALWTRVTEELAGQDLAVGRHSYGGFSDGDPSLSRGTWCAVRHLRPDVVVETGVARGVTSRFILDALERNGHGHLWSVDLPHLLNPSIHDQTGAAVPPDLRKRWSYVRGSSRRRLPFLLKEVGTVGVFVHDSLHTARNMRFEMDHIWEVLTPGGVMFVDDVHNQSFREFVADAPRCDAIVCRSGDGNTGATCPSDLCWAFGVVTKEREPPPAPLP